MPHRKLLRSIKQIFPRESKSTFGTLDIYPHDIHFSTQNKGEKIFIKLRSHVAVNLGWLIRGAFAAILPVLAITLLDALELLIVQLFNDPNMVQAIEEIRAIILSDAYLVIVLLVLYYSGLMSYFLLNFLNWYFDVYLVTNERMLHIEFTVFRGKRVSEAPLKNIQDISQKIIGFLPSILHYGDVQVQTAAERNRFNFNAVPNPTWFRDSLADLARLIEAEEP